MSGKSADKYGQDWHANFVYDPSSASGIVWKVDKFRGNSKSPYVFRKAGEQAGNLSKTGYWTVSLYHGNGRSLPYQVHRIIYEMHHGPITDNTLVIDHIDGCKTNNCIENLRLVKRSDNTRNTVKYSNNSTGVVGVYLDGKSDKNGNVYWYYKAACMNLDGGQSTKAFSINKYGEQEAFRLACEYRAKMIAELNEQGAGYTERHGT
jgi:hypothetical protein